MKALTPEGARSWLTAPSRRWRVAAVAVGFGLRTTWALTATTTPANVFSDSANYLRMAGEIAHLHLPTFGGIPTALYPSGYPITIAPLVWLSKTGLVSLPMAASLFNVVLGTLTIAATGLLAKRWFGPRSAAPTAWLVALAPALIYFTSAAVSETLLICAFVVAMVLLGRIVDSERRTSAFVAVGLLVGYAILVRTPGAVLIVAPALMIRARDHRWRGALRPVVGVALGASVLLVPWTIRNAIQVGVLTPGSTNNAVVMCMGHWDGADGVNTETLAQYERCYPDSPWDNKALPYAPGQVPAAFELGTPNEGKWYRDKTSAAAGWALTHPAGEARLVFWKTFETMSNDADALPISRNFQDGDTWPTPFGAEVLAQAPNIWLWMVLTIAAAGLVLDRRCRAAVPIWGTAILLLVLVWGGVAQAHYKMPVLPLFAVLAGAVIALLAEHGSPVGAEQTDASVPMLASR